MEISVNVGSLFLFCSDPRVSRVSTRKIAICVPFLAVSSYFAHLVAVETFCETRDVCKEGGTCSNLGYGNGDYCMCLPHILFCESEQNQFFLLTKCMCTRQHTETGVTDTSVSSFRKKYLEDVFSTGITQSFSGGSRLLLTRLARNAQTGFTPTEKRNYKVIQLICRTVASLQTAIPPLHRNWVLMDTYPHPSIRSDIRMELRAVTR